MTKLPQVGKLYLAGDKHGRSQELQLTYGDCKFMEESVFIPNNTWILIVGLETDSTKFPYNRTVKKLEQMWCEHAQEEMAKWFQADILVNQKVYKHVWFSRKDWTTWLHEEWPNG